MTESILNTSSLSITSVIPVTDTRVFPYIHFTCTGIITNWLVGHDGQDTGFPVMKIRQSSNLTTTTALNIDNAVNISHNVYNFTVNNGVIVQPGDILMIECNATSPMYYQKGNGPFNYRLGENDILTRIDSNDYPLISVIISKYKHCYTIIIIIIIIIFTEPTTAATSNEMSYTVTDQITTSINPAVSSLSTFTTPSNTIQTAVTSYSISITLSTTITTVTTASSTVTPASITSSTTTTVTTASGTVIPTLQGSTGSTVPAVISTVLILLVVSILVIIIVSVLMYKRRKRFTLKISTGGDGNHDTSTMRKDEEEMSNNPSYQPQGIHTYKYYQHYSCTVKLHEEPINSTITDNPSYGVNKRRNQGSELIYCLFH